MIASLHALSCSNDPCTCEPIYGWVRESEAVEQAFDYNMPNRGETEDRLESRRLGVPTHLGRRAVRVIEVSR